MSRPLLPPGEKRTEFRARLNADHRRALERLATRWQTRSLNEALIRAIVETDAAEDEQ